MAKFGDREHIGEIFGWGETKENPNHDPDDGRFTFAPGGKREGGGRAPVGGTQGMNGEDYRGGQFLPNTTLPKGAHGAKRGSGKPKKGEIAPYKYEEAPTETARSIYTLLSQWGRYNRATDKIERFAHSEAASAYLGTHIAGHSYQDLMEAYNSGTRWIEPKK